MSVRRQRGSGDAAADQGAAGLSSQSVALTAAALSSASSPVLVRTDVIGPPVDVRLRLLPAGESAALTAGEGRAAGGSRLGSGLPDSGHLRCARPAATRPRCRRYRPDQPRVVAAPDRRQDRGGAAGKNVVVGDIGFHGPPEPGPRAVVEIGYAVVPAWQGRGVATRACALDPRAGVAGRRRPGPGRGRGTGVSGGAAEVRFPAPRRGTGSRSAADDRVRHPSAGAGPPDPAPSPAGGPPSGAG